MASNEDRFSVSHLAEVMRTILEISERQSPSKKLHLQQVLIVIPLLSRYFDSRGPKAAGLIEYGWELARETLSRFGEPIVSTAEQ